MVELICCQRLLLLHFLLRQATFFSLLPPPAGDSSSSSSLVFHWTFFALLQNIKGYLSTANHALPKMSLPFNELLNEIIKIVLYFVDL